MTQEHDLNVLALRVAALERRVATLQARPRVPRVIRRLMSELLPLDARAHLREARREQLRAARALLDRWIEPPERDVERHRHEHIRIE